MKRLFAIPLLTLSLTADAFTYLKLGYGINSIDTDEVSIFSDNVQLKPEDSSGVWQLIAGYNAQPNFAIETSYQHFASKGSQERALTLPNQPANTITQDTWHSEIDANRLNVKALYSHDLKNHIHLNTGIGFTITQYDLSSRTSREIKPSGRNVEAISGITTNSSQRKTKVGAVASIGVDYSVWQNFTLGADASISIDSLNSTLQLLGTVGYRF